MRSSLELEEKEEKGKMFNLEMESVFFGVRKVVLFHSNRRWFYSSSSGETKKKKGLKEKKRLSRKKKWVLGYMVMGSHGLSNGYLSIYTMGDEYSDISTIGNE